MSDGKNFTMSLNEILFSLTLQIMGVMMIYIKWMFCPTKTKEAHMRAWKTEHCEKIENCINEYRAEYRITPSNREISRQTGIPTTTVDRYLKHMTELGILEYDSTRRITTREDRKRSRINDRIPLVGHIACGTPMLAEENIEEYISLPDSLIGKGDFFALRAEGQSMIDAGICNGDIVLIRQQEDAQPGQIIAALVDEETATLKRYRPKPDLHLVELEPANPEYKTQVIDLEQRPFSIQGIAVMIIRRLEN